MARSKRGERDFLQRRGNVFWLRLQYSNPILIAQHGKRIERSLGTSDYSTAAFLAADEIKEHRRRLIEATNHRRKQARFQTLGLIYSVGLSTLPDGTRVYADEHKAVLIKDGTEREVPNGVQAPATYDYDPQTPNESPQATISPELAHLIPAGFVPVPRPKAKGNCDRANIFDVWESLKRPNKYIVNEAELGWEAYQRLTNGKPLKDATWADGKMVADHFFAQGNKSATVEKKICHLRSMCNIAIRAGKLKANPFSAVVAKANDETEREPLEEEEMERARPLLQKLRPEDRLCWKILAATGMRLSEAFQIRREFTDKDGLRYWRIGAKTPQSRRRVPIPECLRPLFPEKTRGPLFPEHCNPNMMSKRLMTFIRKRLEIVDATKVVHSLRHRAPGSLARRGLP